MKKNQLLTIAFCFLFLITNAQNIIELHSIANARMAGIGPTSDVGYTLDGLRMTGARDKLTDLSNFGQTGVYTKEIIITDDYYASGSLENIGTVQNVNLFYFGTFNTLEPSLIPFTSAELDSLYQWSVRGGKMIIGASSIAPQYSFQTDILNSRWAFSILMNSNLAETDYHPTAAGATSKIFDGPFGNISIAYQGGSVQGYFNNIPTDAIVLAEDLNGNPNLILDCKTLDLILADGDGHNDLGGVTFGGGMNTENDIFWANAIVFMDSLQGPPVITQNFNVLSTGTYSAYQWLLNGNPISGANAQYYTATQAGNYSVAVTLDCGCTNVASQEVYATSVNEPAALITINLFPNPLSGNELRIEGINEPATISIYNATGQHISDFELNDNTNRIPMNLKSGVYHINIKNKNGTELLNQKLIKF